MSTQPHDLSGLAALADAIVAIPNCIKLWETQAEQWFGPRLRQLAASETSHVGKSGLTDAEERAIRAAWYAEPDEIVSPEEMARYRAMSRSERRTVYAPLQAPPGTYDSLEFKLFYNHLRSHVGLPPEPIETPQAKPKGVEVDQILEVVRVAKG